MLREVSAVLAGRIAARKGQPAAGAESDEDWFLRSRLCASGTVHCACLRTVCCTRIEIIDRTVAESAAGSIVTVCTANLLQPCRDVDPASAETLQVWDNTWLAVASNNPGCRGAYAGWLVHVVRESPQWCW